MKLLRRPILCIFSDFRSKVLFSVGMVGIVGTAGTVDGSCGPKLRALAGGVIYSSCVGSGLLILRFRSDLVLCLFFPRDRVLLILEASSECSFSRSSISPATVLLLVAKFSSAMGRNRISPRSGTTPNASSIAFCSRAAFRLFVTGCSWHWRAVMDIVYAGSKEPPNSRQAEWEIVTRTHDSGR